MIERNGDHTCERCGKSYDWIAIKPEKGKVLFARNEYMNHNIKSFDMVNGYFSVTSQCPYCGALQRANLANEADEQA